MKWLFTNEKKKKCEINDTPIQLPYYIDMKKK